MSLEALREEIVGCKKCPRLIEWCEGARGRNPASNDYDYWGKPVPGFGDPKGRLLIIGLAPGQHGANRTGRPFTGDRAGDWLYQALYRYGFANRATSIGTGDGMQLKDVYITNVVKCAPPNDRPVGAEFKECSPYLTREIRLQKKTQIVLTLGRNSFDRFKMAAKSLGVETKGMVFKHGAIYSLGEGQPIVIATYHSSQRNTNTGRLTPEMWDGIFKNIRSMLGDKEEA